MVEFHLIMMHANRSSGAGRLEPVNSSSLPQETSCHHLTFEELNASDRRRPHILVPYDTESNGNWHSP